MPEPNLDDPKEVYAHFGLAVYRAQVMEEGLINLAVALSADGEDRSHTRVRGRVIRKVR